MPSLTINGYKKIFALFYPAFNEEQFHSYLNLLDVQDKGKLRTFSFGQQKKFVIALHLPATPGFYYWTNPLMVWIFLLK